MTVTPTPVLELTDATFADAVASGVTLVDFYAPWCGPCKPVARIMDELAAGGQVRVAKVNVDDHPVTQGQYRVMGLPTVMLFKDGMPVEGLVGGQSKQAYEALLSRHA